MANFRGEARYAIDGQWRRSVSAVSVYTTYATCATYTTCRRRSKCNSNHSSGETQRNGNKTGLYDRKIISVCRNGNKQNIV